MPMRRDPALWLNMPGVVAAYQPVAAPGPLLARYNQAHGGSNTYQAGDGVAPTWGSATGWTFNGSTQYLNTNAFVASWWTVLVHVDVPVSSTLQVCFGTADTKYLRLGPIFDDSGAFWQQINQTLVIAPRLLNGVMGINDLSCYANGAIVGSISAPTPSSYAYSNAAFLGASNNGGTPGLFLAGTIKSALLVERLLSHAETWNASRQMAYCHVNPDWSAWGRRRRYYYAPSAAAGNVGIYGKRGAVALPGGVRIEAVQ